MSKLYSFSDYDKHMSLKLDLEMWVTIQLKTEESA